MQVLMHCVRSVRELGPGSCPRRGFPSGLRGRLAVSGGRGSSKNQQPRAPHCFQVLWGVLGRCAPLAA